MSFDKKLKALRQENNMTQKFVAKQLNVARSTIAGYETKSRQPSHEKLASLAELFHVTVDYLIDDGNIITLSKAHTPLHSDSEKKLIATYRTLSLKSQADLMEYIHLLELRDAEQGCDA